jgi:hypothetical protein
VYVQTPLETLERPTAVRYADMSRSKAPSFVAKCNIKRQSGVKQWCRVSKSNTNMAQTMLCRNVALRTKAFPFVLLLSERFVYKDKLFPFFSIRSLTLI